MKALVAAVKVERPPLAPVGTLAVLPLPVLVARVEVRAARPQARGPAPGPELAQLHRPVKGKNKPHAVHLDNLSARLTRQVRPRTAKM